MSEPVAYIYEYRINKHGGWVEKTHIEHPADQSFFQNTGVNDEQQYRNVRELYEKEE